MAEKKAPVKRTIVAAESPASAGKTVKQAAPSKKGNATGLRIGAVAFWLLGIGCEVFAVLTLNGTFNFMNPAKGTDNTMTAIIIALVVDAVFVIIGSQLWKKSNDIDPASEKNKVKFFLWNNMGLIASLIAFAPIILLLLSNKELDKKTKTIATVVAVIMLLIAGTASVDYNPTSQEQLAAAEEGVSALGVENVFWTPFGRKYHLDENCQSLTRSTTLITGDINQAFEANRNSPCSFCAVELEEFIEDAA
ncbi:hypothetical protein LJC01_00945 [Clostridiaceae bacterium OttesenSCG-928-D20]|nr:hypothetical protein [Clostridiaceae bacterium OttesenSCG-928-D20]